MSGVGGNGQYHAKTAPLKGAFPLDHEGECQKIVGEYLSCLKRNSQVQGPCRQLVREYFACRMQAGLMGQDDWPSLGLDGGGTAEGDELEGGNKS